MRYQFFVPWYYVLSAVFVEAPRLAVERQERSVSAGSQVTLSCQPTGQPEPEITWSKRNGYLPRSVGQARGRGGDRKAQYGSIYCTVIFLHVDILDGCIRGLYSFSYNSGTASSKSLGSINEVHSKHAKKLSIINSLIISFAAWTDPRF